VRRGDQDIKKSGYQDIREQGIRDTIECGLRNAESENIESHVERMEKMRG
jgi:hypothetical protein